jgi:uncharacterized protein
LTRLQLGCLALVIGVALPLTATLRHARAPSPALSVVDGAGLLSAGERSAIASFHDRLLADYDIDYRVVTAVGNEDVDGVGHEAFGALGVGSRSGSGRGLLLLINPSADRVRLEVAAGLEGVFTDTFVAYLEQRQMVPFSP